MNQFAQFVCYFYLPNNRNLNFIANRNYPLLYHVGSFKNDLLFTKNQFCVLQSRAKQLQFMADALKSNFQLHIPKEQVSGDLNEKNEWNGMMRLFKDKVIDFVFNDFSYQKIRETVVKYSVPIEINYRFAILSRKTFHQPDFNILSIFDWPIWALMLIFCILCLLVLFFVFQIRDIIKLMFDFLGIFLGLGTVIDTAYTYIPRPILSLWLMGTLIFTFILRNEILALFSARFIDKIDSIDDIKARNLKVLVQSDSNQMSVLKIKIKLHNIVPIVWTDLWTVETKEKVLSGTHVLVFNEDKLDVMVSVNPEYPLRISDEKKDLRFGYYLFRVDINRTLERKVNKCIKILDKAGIYGYLKINSFREYETFEKRKNALKLETLPGGLHNRRKTTKSNENEDPDKVRDLTLADIDNSFYCLFYGWIASFVACIGELLLERVRANVHD